MPEPLLKDFPKLEDELLLLRPLELDDELRLLEDEEDDRLDEDEEKLLLPPPLL